MSHLEPIRTALRKMPLLASVPELLLDALALRVKEQHFQHGEVLIREGEKSSSLYLIAYGEVDVFKDHNGREFPLARIGAGEPFGEMALIDDAPRSATVRVASDRLTVLQMEKSDVLDTMQIHPPALYEVLRLLSARLRSTQVNRVQELETKFEELAEANRRLQSNYTATLTALSNALDLRDQSTVGHSERVGAYSLAIADVLGLSEQLHEALRLGALLHDIGKIGVSDGILRKPGALNKEETKEMRNHPTWGKHIVEGIDFLRPALDIVYAHHERWDGRGYPQGLRTDQIPLSARIFAVADVFDALTMERPYKVPWTAEQAREQIIKDAGTAFDPRIVAAFVKVYSRFVEIVQKAHSARSQAERGR